MSTRKDRLKLGPLPKVQQTKVSFACTTVLRDELERYAALHAQTYGEAVDASALIPHMLVAFMAQDAAFRRAKKAPRQPGPPAAPAARQSAAPAR